MGRLPVDVARDHRDARFDVCVAIALAFSGAALSSDKAPRTTMKESVSRRTAVKSDDQAQSAALPRRIISHSMSLLQTTEHRLHSASFLFRSHVARFAFS